MKKLTTAAVVTMALASATSVSAAASHQSTGVSWHPQQAPEQSGPVAGADATLVRHDHGVRFRLTTAGLTSGNVYTLWLVVVNDPDECAASPCTGGDVLQNPATRSQVTYAAGHVVGGAGTGTFAGHAKVGPLDGWLADRALEDARTAEIHLVLNDHGPAIPGAVADMLSTYRGGCSDDSPFPGIFPPTALEDGEPGPNTCRLAQSAIFTAP